MLELMYVVSSEGTMNMVSRSGERWRFISAIWNSYSKSLTARRPRMISRASTSPGEIDQEAGELADLDARLVVHRGADQVDPFLHGEQRLLGELVATATTSRSTNPRLRRIRSSWPRVMGSKLPA